MSSINRQPAKAAESTYDLIIIGGGIYGVMLSLEAALRGLRPLLVERHDFGQATSYNSLRIIHGGLRYLQTLDLHRFFESVGERCWFLQNFPDLVKPLPCLMPLYGNGVRRTSVFRVALSLNAFLSQKRNNNLRLDRYLPAGSVITPEQVKHIFPLVDVEGLQGGAVWYDASMPDSQRLLIEGLLWACGLGATALNYVEVQQLLKTKSGVAGVSATDSISGESYEYKAKVVVNAAGPWCREVAAHLDQDEPNLFKSSIAWNILFDRKALSDFALAVEPRKPGSRTYFLHPWKGMLLAGTGHAPWTRVTQSTPSLAQIVNFIEDLNEAIPGLKLTPDNILHVFAGLLPVTKDGSTKLADREVILEHSQHGGPRGLYSISGVKFTTSRLVAEKTISKIFPNAKHVTNASKEFITSLQKVHNRGVFDYKWCHESNNCNWKSELREIIIDESVQHLDDLILRRTSIGYNRVKALEAATTVCQLFDWNNTRCQQEISRLEKYYSLNLLPLNNFVDKV